MSEGPDDMADLRMLGDDVPVTDPVAKARARARLEDVIQQEQVRPRTHISWRRFAAAAAVAAALVTLASWSLLQRSIAPSPVPSTQETALLQLAMVASSQAAPTTPVGSFVYTRSRVRAKSSDVIVTGEELGSQIVTSHRETWVAQDGSGLILERRIHPASTRTERIEVGPGSLRLPDFDELPTRPLDLLEAIMRSEYLGQPDDGFETLSGIGALLRDPYVSPAHRQALFLIVRDMEGVEVDENYRDPLGRLGVAVSLGDGARSVILVFEPGTSRLLMEGEDRAGRVFQAVYIETAVVSAIGGTPGEADP
jgi:hypothetical protein